MYGFEGQAVMPSSYAPHGQAWIALYQQQQQQMQQFALYQHQQLQLQQQQQLQQAQQMAGGNQAGFSTPVHMPIAVQASSVQSGASDRSKKTKDQVGTDAVKAQRHSVQSGLGSVSESFMAGSEMLADTESDEEGTA